MNNEIKTKCGWIINFVASENAITFILDNKSVHIDADELKDFLETKLKTNKLEKSFTVKESAQILNVSERTIFRYIKDGTLQTFMQKNRHKILESELMKFRKSYIK